MISATVKKFLVGVALAAVVFVGSVSPTLAAYNASTTEQLITDNVAVVGDGIYTSATGILTAILPYAIGLMCVFLAVHMAVRWLRRSVG